MVANDAHLELVKALAQEWAKQARHLPPMALERLCLKRQFARRDEMPTWAVDRGLTEQDAE